MLALNEYNLDCMGERTQDRQVLSVVNPLIPSSLQWGLGLFG